MRRELTARQKLFIAEYLQCRNAAKAARNAGYSVKTARSSGHRLLTKADIAAAVEKGLADKLERVELSADRLISELSRAAMSEGSMPGVNKLRAIELLGKSMGLFTKKSNQAEPIFLTSMLLERPRE